jgi:hypothetical protein
VLTNRPECLQVDLVSTGTSCAAAQMHTPISYHLLVSNTSALARTATMLVAAMLVARAMAGSYIRCEVLKRIAVPGLQRAILC